MLTRDLSAVASHLVNFNLLFNILYRVCSKLSERVVQTEAGGRLSPEILLSSVSALEVT